VIRAFACIAAVATLALGAAVALAAQKPPAAGPDPVVLEWTEWPHRVSCAGMPFDPVASFGSQTGAERERTPQARALRRFIAFFPDEYSVRKHDWRLLAEEGREATFGAGRLPDELEVISVERRKGAWKGWGYSSNCEPATLRKGREAIGWDLDPDQPQLSRKTRSILVDLGPGECNGGKPQADRLQKPEFREQNGALLMSLWLRPLPPGGYTCQGLIEPPVRIQLPEPLGDRPLMDGGTYPPRLEQLRFGR
jgi:hypothetical protein